MGLEGELRLKLRLQAGRIAGVELDSTRPDVATSLLQGRRVNEVQAAVPLMFSVCARSQAAACRLALAAAAGDDGQADPPDVGAERAAVAEEIVRETAWNALLQCPRWLGETTDAAALLAARAVQGWRYDDRSAANEALARTMAQGVYGIDATAWLALDRWPALLGWADAGATPMARYLRGLAAQALDVPEPPAPGLWASPSAQSLRELADAVAADPGHARRPTSQGAPAETGALARLHDDPLVGQQAGAAPSRLLARHVARLRELALLLCARRQPGLGALTLGPGSGVGWVDNARGLLVHHAQTRGEVVSLYRIVAPTEWNFHPEGALRLGLGGVPVADAAAARQRALSLINSLDPCVSCTVEVHDA